MTARGYYRLERASALCGCPGIVLELHHHVLIYLGCAFLIGAAC